MLQHVVSCHDKGVALVKGREICKSSGYIQQDSQRSSADLNCHAAFARATWSAMRFSCPQVMSLMAMQAGRCAYRIAVQTLEVIEVSRPPPLRHIEHLLFSLSPLNGIENSSCGCHNASCVLVTHPFIHFYEAGVL